jgi:hypothetical protein
MWELISFQKIASADFHKNQKNSSVLGHHYFAQKPPCTSQIKFKPALHSLSLGLDSVGVIIPADWKSVSVPAADFQSFFVVSEPSHPMFGGGCSPTTIGSITTLFFSSRNFSQYG